MCIVCDCSNSGSCFRPFPCCAVALSNPTRPQWLPYPKDNQRGKHKLANKHLNEWKEENLIVDSPLFHPLNLPIILPNWIGSPLHNFSFCMFLFMFLELTISGLVPIPSSETSSLWLRKRGSAYHHLSTYCILFSRRLRQIRSRLRFKLLQSDNLYTNSLIPWCFLSFEIHSGILSPLGYLMSHP